MTKNKTMSRAKKFGIKASLAAVAFTAPSTAFGWDIDRLISTDNTSLLLSADKGSTLRFSYYGPKIEQSDINPVHDTWAGANRAAYPAFGDITNRLTSFQMTHADGNITTFLQVDSVYSEPTGKGEATVFILKDKHYPVTVRLHYLPVKGSDIIEMWATVTNNGKKDVTIRRIDSGFLPIRRGDAWVTHLHGAWTAESQVSAEPLSTGIKSITNLDGARNAHSDQAAGIISLDGEPQANSGNAIGGALCWSGNFDIRINTEDENYHSLMAGISSENSETRLAPKESFTTPRFAITYSTEGTGGVTRNFHRYARTGAVHGTDTPRDILLNSWEGVYLDVTEDKIKEMMRDFAELGGELFVMDDGWFGSKYPRKHDNSALGDWTTDTEKLPGGIQALIDTAKSLGIKFGIWIEPESVNTLSELYEKHPDWVLEAPNRDLKLTRGGTQLLLDLSNPEVQDFVFSVVDNLMTQYPDIAYMKWDANTEIQNYGSANLPADRQLQMVTEYHHGLENVLKRIRAKYPDLVLQACGGGGGRVNYGTMPYFDEVWVSDNTDALQRLYIQYGTSLFYPPIALAQHVSASPNHQTGRVIPMKFRFDVAMTGRLGMEMQPSAMTPGEKEFAKNAISEYKAIRDIVQNGDLYHIISPYDRKGVASQISVSPDKNRGVFFAFKLENFRYQQIPRFHMAGLNPGKTYRIREINGKSSPLDGKQAKGSLLMDAGFELPLDGEYASRVYELTAID